MTERGQTYWEKALAVFEAELIVKRSKLLTKGQDLLSAIGEEIAFLNWQCTGGWARWTALLPDFLAKRIWRIAKKRKAK